MSSTVVHVGRPELLCGELCALTHYIVGEEYCTQHKRERSERLLQLLVTQKVPVIDPQYAYLYSGKITSLSVTPASEAENSPQSATVTFEKET